MEELAGCGCVYTFKGTRRVSEGTRWKFTAGAQRDTNTLTCCQKPDSTPSLEEQEGNGGDETQAELK